jgi:Family of unknown function (DUF6093)
MSGSLAAARARAERRMQARAKVWRKAKLSLDTASLDLVGGDQTDGDREKDPVPGLESLPVRVKSSSAAVFNRDAEGLLLAVQDVVLCFPALTIGLRVRDEVEILDGGPDPGLTGRRFVVTGIPAQSEAVEARFPVEQSS